MRACGGVGDAEELGARTCGWVVTLAEYRTRATSTFPAGKLGTLHAASVLGCVVATAAELEHMLTLYRV